MECRISQDLNRLDSFLHLRLASFQQLVPESTSKDEGVCVELRKIEDSSQASLLSWAIPSQALSKSRACSAVIPSGRYLLTKKTVSRINRATLQATDSHDYEAILQNASIIIERLFLEQVRILQKDSQIQLWCDSDGVGRKKVNLLVMRLEPDLQVGIVGIDSELEILPPTFEPSRRVNSPLDRKETRVRDLRVRQCVSRVETDCGFIHPEHQLSGIVMISNGKGRQEQLPVRQSLLFSPLPGWIYIPSESMTRLGLEQHQRIKVVLFERNDTILDNSGDPFGTDCKENVVRSVDPFFDEIQAVLGRILQIVPTRGVIIQGARLAGKSTCAQRMVDMAFFPSVYLDFEACCREKSFQAKMRLMEEKFARIAPIAPCIVFIDHLDDLLCCDPAVAGLVGEEETFLKQQLVATFLDHVEVTMLIMQSPTVLLVESELHLVPLVKKSMFWIKTFTICDIRIRNGHLVEDDDAFGSQIGIPRWNELPGLDGAKEKLEEFLLWPMLYENIYAANGHQLPGGVLLSGPTGVGKSMLARSFAQHLGSLCTLGKVFWVSGAAMLGKYVGSSERAVRDLFAKARDNRPSVIIIEELDALAPCRGRDNTGTTDRVVNQLLTELDGAEERNSVFVLAISSRPDLVDPAVLRPGRIDCRIDLTVPREAEDRRLILEYFLTDESGLTLDRSLISHLAQRTDGWTGAEMRGLVLEARLAARYKGVALDFDVILDTLVQLSDGKRERLLELGPERRPLQRITFA